MKGFPISGFPVLANVVGGVSLNNLYSEPLKASGYAFDINGTLRSGAITCGAINSGAITSNGALSINGGIIGAVSMANSGTYTSTWAATGGLYNAGLTTVAPLATALLRANNSPVVRLGSSTWNGSATEVNSMELVVKPDAFGSAITSGRFVLKNSTYDNVITDTDVLTISATGNLTSLGTTFGPEVLQDSTFDTAPTTNWTVTGDWAYTTNDYTFTRSTGSGTITQNSSRFLIPAIANRWYKLTYVVGVAGPAGTEMWIGTEFANNLIRMQCLSVGTYVAYLKSNSAPGNLVLYATASVTSGLQIDSLSLVEVQSGDITASGSFTGGGTGGLKINQDGSSTFSNTLAINGVATLSNGAILGTPASGNFSTGTFTWPTFNQNTTGTASNVTGTVAIANGGTGATTAATAVVSLGVRTSSTGSEIIPSGTTAQRDGTPLAGYFRFNSTNVQFEGYNGTAWSGVGGASGGGGNPIMYENDSVVSVNYTMTTGKNASSTGPLTINSGISVTVPTGSTWVIL
jgi:hypothetical protein